MKKEQLKKLKKMMDGFRNSQGEDREHRKQAILAYLDACLDGIVIKD